MGVDPIVCYKTMESSDFIQGSSFSKEEVLLCVLLLLEACGKENKSSFKIPHQTGKGTQEFL